MQRIAATGSVKNDQDRSSVDWMFIVLEIGRAVIHLRRDGQQLQQDALQKRVTNICHDLAELFAKPSDVRRLVVLAAVNDTIVAVAQDDEMENSAVRGAILASLHSIRIPLVDSASMFCEEVDHAPRICPA